MTADTVRDDLDARRVPTEDPAHPRESEARHGGRARGGSCTESSAARGRDADAGGLLPGHAGRPAGAVPSHGPYPGGPDGGIAVRCRRVRWPPTALPGPGEIEAHRSVLHSGLRCVRALQDLRCLVDMNRSGVTVRRRLRKASRVRAVPCLRSGCGSAWGRGPRPWDGGHHEHHRDACGGPWPRPRAAGRPAGLRARRGRPPHTAGCAPRPSPGRSRDVGRCRAQRGREVLRPRDPAMADGGRVLPAHTPVVVRHRGRGRPAPRASGGRHRRGRSGSQGCVRLDRAREWTSRAEFREGASCAEGGAVS